MSFLNRTARNAIENQEEIQDQQVFISVKTAIEERVLDLALSSKEKPVTLPKVSFFRSGEMRIRNYLLRIRNYLLRIRNYLLQIRDYLLRIRNYLLRIRNYLLQIRNYLLRIRNYLLRMRNYLLRIRNYLLRIRNYFLRMRNYLLRIWNYLLRIRNYFLRIRNYLLRTRNHLLRTQNFFFSEPDPDLLKKYRNIIIMKTQTNLNIFACTLPNYNCYSSTTMLWKCRILIRNTSGTLWGCWPSTTPTCSARIPCESWRTGSASAFSAARVWAALPVSSACQRLYNRSTTGGWASL